LPFLLVFSSLCPFRSTKKSPGIDNTLKLEMKQMEKLLSSPPPTLEEQFSTLNDTVEVPSSGNGAYLAKPFSGYVS
jgi:hypothetical protein